MEMTVIPLQPHPDDPVVLSPPFECPGPVLAAGVVHDACRAR